ncbi:hypothetical protein CUJ83_11220 [Methanocella sp. CWC-04]|uniref:DUF5817 domain-containing protein n=1 Tax=Methanooceanicella nereidis TaxID=2052831 RepID=A0AAP2RDX9_9EURY|nr:DUF5817 domain-containing protein [Methanocella sp. CWC-04]MCD1295569.1 hypothetical protein [Methanocella sp. CWC-04]
MHRYAVVVCPQCRNPFIIETGPKTISCRNCNKKHETSKLRVFFTTDDLKEAQTARGGINASMSGDTAAFDEIKASGALSGVSAGNIPEDIHDERFLEDKRKVDEIMKLEARKTKKAGQQTVLKDTFEELSLRGDVSVEEYWNKVSFHNISREKFEEWVEKMIQSGMAFSPKYGYLRKS